MLGDGAPRRTRVVIDAMALLTVASLTLASWSFYDRITASRNTQSNTVSAIRTVLCFAEQRIETDPTVPPDERARAVAFYTQALARIDALPCAPITNGGTR